MIFFDKPNGLQTDGLTLGDLVWFSSRSKPKDETMENKRAIRSPNRLDELLEAVRNGRVREVQRLALSDNWLELPTHALTTACQCSSLEMVRWLIEEGGSDVNGRRDLSPETSLETVLYSKSRQRTESAIATATQC